jgi:Ca2+-binding RTX toxin-like protein
MEVLDLNMNAGDDTLTTESGLGAFKIDANGEDGNDVIDGGDAADLLQGGNNNDRIIPDDNPLNTTDVARGDAGDDTMVWNGGDDDDTNDGGDGNDTTEVNGAPQGETFTVKPSTTAGRVRFDRTSQNPALLLNAGGGDDKVHTDKGLAGLIAGEFNGGDGNDLVEGTDSPDRLNGDKGHDVILAKDRAEDLLDCGPGLDLAKVDRRDFLRNCNIIIGGHLKVRVDAKKLAVVNGRAVMPLECAGTKKCKGVVKVRSGGKTLASGKFNIKKRSKTVRLKLNDKGRRLSALGKSVTVHIDAKDTKGNGWRTTQKLKLTR